MNYWLVTTEYPPQSGGGISTYCYHTGRMLCQFGHKVYIFIPNTRSTKISIKETDYGALLIYFPIKTVDHLGHEASLSLSLSNILPQFLEESKAPDVIEFQEYNGIAYYSLQRKWLESDYFEKTIFLVTAHAPSYLYFEYNQAPRYSFPEYWIGEMEKNVLSGADIVISPSQYLLDKINLQHCYSKAILNPFELGQKIQSDIEIGDIAFFGKLTPQKGALEMLNYFEHAWNRGEKYRLNIIGGGGHFFYPRKEDLDIFIKRKYAHRIEEGLLNFEGHISPKNLPKRLSKAHIIVIPSIVDNLPYTVIEAMSQGKVVLASVDGGQKELINDGQNGFLFDHQIENSFDGKLKVILDLNNEGLLQIGNRAKETILERCNYEKIYNLKAEFINSFKVKKRNQFPFIRPQPESQNIKNYTFEKGLLSVVIPYYNMGKYVIECLDSIAQNDFDNYEIIIVNDGSSDSESLEKLSKLNGYKNLRIIHKENTGLSDTRNVGASYATGEFIAFLDPDDSIEPSYYSKAVGILNQYKNVSFVGCWAQYFGVKNYIWPSFNPEPPYLLAHNTLNSSAIVIRKNDYLNFGLNDKQFIYGMEDYDSIINLVKNGKNGVVIPECLWNYRIRQGSLAQSFNKYSKQYLYTLLSKRHSDFYAKYTEEVVNLLNANGPGMNFDNPTKKLGMFHGINLPFNNSKLINTLKGNKFLRKIAKRIYSKLSN